MTKNEPHIDLNAYRQFLLDEIEKRHMTVHSFALAIGVSHTTISRACNPKGTPPMPTLPLLVRIADYINIDITTLVALLVPRSSRPRPLAALFAQLASSLSENEQRTLLTLLKGIGVKPPDKERTNNDR